MREGRWRQKKKNKTEAKHGDAYDIPKMIVFIKPNIMSSEYKPIKSKRQCTELAK